MRRRHFRTACIAILVALALGAGIASTATTSAAESPAAPGAGAITTELQSGWNMVGWVGPATLSGQLFEELPALRLISAWDAEEQRYRRARPNINRNSLRLMPGMGLLLFIDGDAPLQWTHPIEPDGALQRLRPGLNLVGWTGDDGTAVGEALDRLGDSVIAAWDWDAGSGQYASYDLSASGAASTRLRRGDALWIRVSEPVNWWQPGMREPPVVFLGDVPDHFKIAIRSEYENVQRFFAERFGVVTRGTQIYVGADEKSVRAIHLELFGRGPEQGFCGRSTSRDVYVAVLRCATPHLLGLDGRHLRVLLTPGNSVRDPGGSDWMIRGAEEYSHARYRAAVGSGRYDTSRRAVVRDARGAGFALRSLEVGDPGADSWRNGQIDALAFLAVEWLAARAGDPAIIEYFHLLPSHGTWQKAFAAAFGITVEDFYTEFEAYRQVVAPLLPHVADDRSQPVIEWVGEVPADAREEISTDFETDRNTPSSPNVSRRSRGSLRSMWAPISRHSEPWFPYLPPASRPLVGSSGVTLPSSPWRNAHLPSGKTSSTSRPCSRGTTFLLNGWNTAPKNTSRIRTMRRRLSTSMITWHCCAIWRAGRPVHWRAGRLARESSRRDTARRAPSATSR